MFKFLFQYLSIKSLLIEQPKQNNIHFDVEKREKMKKLNSEINQYYEILQQSYASKDDYCYNKPTCYHSDHDYSSYDNCSDSSSGSCDSGSD